MRFLDILNNLNIAEIISYFSCETVLLFAFLFNITMFLIFKRNRKAKRLCDFAVSIALSFNVLLCLIFYLLNTNNTQFGTSFLNNLLYFDLDIVFVKTVINLILLVFLFSVYKLIRPANYKSILSNAYLCLIGFASCILAQCNNVVLTFFFLDFVVYLISKYSSSMKLKNSKFFSSEFLLLNLVSDFIFYIVVLILNFNDSDFQIAILNNILFMAYLLKIGIFPCVNYFSFQNHKNNLPDLIMRSVYLPFFGMVGFVKIFNGCALSGDIFFIATTVFLVVCMFNLVIVASKTKNIAEFFASSSLFFMIFVIMDFLMSLNSHFSLKLASLYLFAVFGVFALLCIFKINNKEEKLLAGNFRGLFLKNGKYAFFLSSAILFLFSIIPSGLLKNSFEGIKNIYSYDQSCYILFVLFLLADIALILKVFDFILNFYNYDGNSKTAEFNKKTTLNYAAFWISIIFLMVFVL